jgi:hypothetical protein
MDQDVKEKAKFVNLRLEYGNTCEALPTTGGKPRYKVIISSFQPFLHSSMLLLAVLRLVLLCS